MDANCWLPLGRGGKPSFESQFKMEVR